MQGTKKALMGVTLALSAVFTASVASAQESGAYLGVGVGQSKVDIDSAGVATGLRNLGLTNSGVATDESDTGWKIFGGYNINKNFAIEAAFIDLGNFSATTTVTAVRGTAITPTPVTASVKAEEGLYLAAVGTVPLTNQFSVFGKLGVYSIKTKLNVSVAGTTVSDSDRNEDVMFGLGVGYSLNRNVGIRAEWERFNKVGNKDRTGEGDMDYISIGLVYKF